MRSSLTPGSGAAAGVFPAGNLSLGYLELSRIGVVFRQGYSRLAGVGRPEQGPLGGEQESLTGLISARSAWLELDFGRFPSISSLSGPPPPLPPRGSVSALKQRCSSQNSAERNFQRVPNPIFSLPDETRIWDDEMCWQLVPPVGRNKRMGRIRLALLSSLPIEQLLLTRMAF